MRTDLENSLLAMITEGWANRSLGDVDSDGFHMSLITVSPAELAEVREAFSDVPDFADVTGNWILTENDLGQIFLEDFSCEASAVTEYLRREREFYHD